MNAKPFLDTNVIVYAFSSNDLRSKRAEALLEGGGVVSVQVLNEFVNVHVASRDAAGTKSMTPSAS
jgi:predicted nucleic acid-binding protein